MISKAKQTMLLSSLWLLSCSSAHAQRATYDLAIRDVSVFDSKTKQVRNNRTILIKGGLIVGIVESSRRVRAARVIEGQDRLVVPGFIDTHTHLRNVYGTIEDVEKSPGGLDRNKLAATYLKYGTTTIVDMGQPEKWLATSRAWEKNPAPEYPNIYVSGGALASPEQGRTTYMNHVAVSSPDEARAKVREYASQGMGRIKIYWKLRKPELEAAVAEGKKQNLTISAHLDNNVTSIWEAIDLGVKNFEHVLALPSAVLTLNEHRAALRTKYGLRETENVDQFLAQILFYFDYIRENPEWNAKLEALFDKMAQNNITLSTAVHFMGSLAGKTYFPTSLNIKADSVDLAGYTPAQKQKLGQCFDVMMRYLKYAHDQGVRIRIGTDCKDGGKALLSELLLLHEANFPTEDILQIATWNGAKAMNLDDKYGAVEPGKKADLVLFEKSPFADYQNFLAGKVIIKGGKVLAAP